MDLWKFKVTLPLIWNEVNGMKYLLPVGGMKLTVLLFILIIFKK